jgi:Peptidase M50B-like
LKTDRLHQVLLIGSLLPLSWLLMMVVHEFGHVLGAWLTGGGVAKVVLHPLAISRTDLAVNPQPLLVAAAGPFFGVVLPLAALGLAWLARMPGRYLVRFFAGFCLIANGGYIAAGSFEGIGDAGDLLRHGAAEWQLWLFGALTFPLGLYLWHGEGPHFGLGKEPRKVQPLAACACLGLLAVILVSELLFGGSSKLAMVELLLILWAQDQRPGPGTRLCRLWPVACE